MAAAAKAAAANSAAAMVAASNSAACELASSRVAICGRYESYHLARSSWLHASHLIQLIQESNHGPVAKEDHVAIEIFLL